MHFIYLSKYCESLREVGKWVRIYNAKFHFFLSFFNQTFPELLAIREAYPVNLFNQIWLNCIYHDWNSPCLNSFPYVAFFYCTLCKCKVEYLREKSNRSLHWSWCIVQPQEAIMNFIWNISFYFLIFTKWISLPK